ncbi:MAG: 4Fe-4S dicluster-binding protein [Thermoplasmata archaeon]
MSHGKHDKHKNKSKITKRAKILIHDIPSPRSFRSLIKEQLSNSPYDGGKKEQKEEIEKEKIENVKDENLLEKLEYVIEGPACYDGECRQTFEISKSGWKKIPIGGINPNAGSGAKYHTGSWRIRKPMYRTSKCIQCFQCWISCPDVAINVNEKRVQGIEYYHCKGCGICAQVCPTSAIVLVDEDEDWGTETHTEVGPGEVIHKGHTEPETR